MILAGDVGGTKTVLALYSSEYGVAGGPVRSSRYESGRYGSLEEVVGEFLRETGARPRLACFGVAGPVKGGRARITNLPWEIDAGDLASRCGIPRVELINDLEALTVAVPHLGPDDLFTLKSGTVDPRGNRAVIAPGTGLGIAFLVWTGDAYKVCASEGGHTAFSPRGELETELLTFLERRFGHVSFERVCSGSHLPDIYDFFREKGTLDEPEPLKRELSEANDRTPLIVRAALEQGTEICKATLDLFVRALATVAGNMAVTMLTTGGIYLGGGIPPRILERLNQPAFLDAISDKGRFSELISEIPVHVIRDPNTALHGAARHAMGLGVGD